MKTTIGQQLFQPEGSPDDFQAELEREEAKRKAKLDPRNVCSRCAKQLVGPYPGAFEPIVCYSCKMTF